MRDDLPEVIIWTRAGTEAGIDQQIDQIMPYARNQWGEQLGGIEYSNDRIKRALHNQTHAVICDNHLGILAERIHDAGREGMPAGQYLDRLIEQGPVQRIAVATLTTLDQVTVEKALTTPSTITPGAAVHDVSRGVVLAERADISPAVQRVITELTADETDDDATPLGDGIEHEGGRPPLGTRVEDGMLVPDDNYDDVVQALQHVDAGAMSAATAAKQLDCCRRTIGNAVKRRELYQLD